MKNNDEIKIKSGIYPASAFSYEKLQKSEKVSRIIIYVLSFVIPFAVFLTTMHPSTFGYDTTWFHIQIPMLAVGQPTGFPLVFLLGKLFTLLPFTPAFSLNLFSVFWGAATVLVFVMIVSNLLKKEYFIALVSTLTMSFFYVFWYQTNRFEVYTFHTFLIGAVILFGIYFDKTKKYKFLCLYYLFIGLSFTNHPLSLFLSPALILFPVITSPREIFKVKRFFTLLLLMLSPLLLYLYIPIRSLQGYGKITTFNALIDYVTGAQWKQQFGFKSIEIFQKQAFNYWSLIRDDFSIIILIIILIGAAALIIKNRKYLYLTLALLILNLIPIFLYEETASHFYLVSVITFFIIPFSFGFYMIKELAVIAYSRISAGIKKKREGLSSQSIKEQEEDFDNDKEPDYKQKTLKNSRILRIAFLSAFFILISLIPLSLAFLNFDSMQRGKDTQIYDFWTNVISKMDDNSIIITSSKSANVALYILKYETDKKIDLEIGRTHEELLNILKDNLGNRSIYFNEVYLPPIKANFEVEQVGEKIFWHDFAEDLVTYKILGYKKYIDFEPFDSSLSFNFGEIKTIGFKLSAHGDEEVSLSSIELLLPKNLKLLGMDESSDMDQMPGMARGIYMWTNGPYIFKPGEEFNIAVQVQAVAPGDSEILMKVTTMNIYEESPVTAVSID